MPCLEWSGPFYRRIVTVLWLTFRHLVATINHDHPPLVSSGQRRRRQRFLSLCYCWLHYYYMVDRARAVQCVGGWIRFHLQRSPVSGRRVPRRQELPISMLIMMTLSVRHQFSQLGFHLSAWTCRKGHRECFCCLHCVLCYVLFWGLGRCRCDVEPRWMDNGCPIDGNDTGVLVVTRYASKVSMGHAEDNLRARV